MRPAPTATAAAFHHQLLVSPELGGAGAIGLQVADHVRLRGLNSRVWLPSTGRAMDAAREMRVPVGLLDCRCAFQKSRLQAVFGNWRVAHALRRWRPGIVHVHSPAHYGAIAHGLSLTGLRRVLHLHLENDLELLPWALRRPPEMVITCAEFLKERALAALPDRLRPRVRVEAVPNAVDTAHFVPADRQLAKAALGAPHDVPLILMLANLAPHKGQETAIRAVAALRRRGKRVLCWLAGVERTGPAAYGAKLMSLARELGVADCVQFLGFRKDAVELLQAADCLVLPSTAEGLPLTILEAQATKTVVIAAPTAGIPEVVTDGHTGFLVAADNPGGYADRIQQILEDRCLERRISQAAFEQVTRHHTWPTYIDRIVGLYGEVLAPHAKRHTTGALVDA